MMRQYYKYTLLFCALSGLLASCEKEEPTLFDTESGGVYFDYGKPEDFKRVINFADDIVGEPTEISTPLNIKLLGHLSDNETSIVLKAKPVENYPEAQVELPEIILPAGEYTVETEIKVLCPAEEETRYAVCLYMESELGEGIDGREEFTLYVEKSYREPDNWGLAGYYFGNWNKEKHIFIAKTLGNNNFISSDYYAMMEANVAVVHSVHSLPDNDPVRESLDIPILDSQGMVFYDKPGFWGELQDQYAGAYNNDVYVKLAERYQLNTANEKEFFCRPADEMKALNKELGSLRLELYNGLFYQGWDCYGQELTGIPLYADVDYDLAAPPYWTDEEVNADTNESCRSMVEKYYGEYTEEKYKFMIRTCIDEFGPYFSFVSIFPVIKQFDYDQNIGLPQWYYDWYGIVNGEETIIEMNRLFRERSAGTGIQFPEITAVP